MLTPTCCACGQPTDDRFLVNLDARAPDDAIGWTCPLCELPGPGAIALVCNACRLAGVPIRVALAGSALDSGLTVPVAELDGPLLHQWEKHGLGPARPATGPLRRALVGGGDPDALADVPGEVLGEVRRASQHVHYFTGADLIVEMAADHCRAMTALALEAALFHQLLHVSEDDNGNLAVGHHDFEGFLWEIEIYGPWRDDLRRAGERFQQLTLAL